MFAQTDNGQSITQVQLEKVRFGVQRALSRELFEEMTVNVRLQESFANAFVAEVQHFLWSEDAGQREVRYPADWWEALKDRWFPLSWKQRWPVRWQVEHFYVKCVYPGFRPSLPNEQHRMRLIQQTSQEIRP